MFIAESPAPTRSSSAYSSSVLYGSSSSSSSSSSSTVSSATPAVNTSVDPDLLLYVVAASAGSITAILFCIFVMIPVTVILATRRQRNKAKPHLEQETEVEHYSEPIEHYSEPDEHYSEPTQHDHAEEIEAYATFSDTLSMSTLDPNMDRIAVRQNPSYKRVEIR